MCNRLIFFSKVLLRIRGPPPLVAFSEASFLRRFIFPPHVSVGDAQPSAHRVAAVIDALLGIVALMVMSKRSHRDDARTRSGASHFCLHRIIGATFLALRNKNSRLNLGAQHAKAPLNARP